MVLPIQSLIQALSNPNVAGMLQKTRGAIQSIPDAAMQAYTNMVASKPMENIALGMTVPPDVPITPQMRQDYQSSALQQPMTVPPPIINQAQAAEAPQQPEPTKTELPQSEGDKKQMSFLKQLLLAAGPQALAAAVSLGVGSDEALAAGAGFSQGYTGGYINEKQRKEDRQAELLDSLLDTQADISTKDRELTKDVMKIASDSLKSDLGTEPTTDQIIKRTKELMSVLDMTEKLREKQDASKERTKKVKEEILSTGNKVTIE